MPDITLIDPDVFVSDSVETLNNNFNKIKSELTKINDSGVETVEHKNFVVSNQKPTPDTPGNEGDLWFYVGNNQIAKTIVGFDKRIESLSPVSFHLLNQDISTTDLSDEADGSKLSKQGLGGNVSAMEFTSFLNLDGKLIPTNSRLEAQSSSAMQISGDLTIGLFYKTPTSFTQECSLVSCGAAGETEDLNFLYDLRIDTSGQLKFIHEFGAGVNEELVGGSGATLANATEYFILIERNTTQKTIRFYVNGFLKALVPYSNEASGGGLGVYQVGSDLDKQNVSRVFLLNNTVTDVLVAELYGLSTPDEETE